MNQPSEAPAPPEKSAFQSVGAAHHSAQKAAGRTNPWLVFLLPFVVYMLVGSFEPSPPSATPAAAGNSSWLHLDIPYSAYPLIYTLKIALTVAALAYVWPGLRQFPWRVNWGLAVGIGVVGVVAWVLLAIFQRWLMDRLGWSLALGTRSAFNPLEQLADRPALAYAFLAIRFFGLALLVPVIEEFFLRGFVMRYFVHQDWWIVRFGTVNRLAVVLGTAVPVLMHPQEALAAAVWFSAVTWLMLRTHNIWDCVTAHASTNLLMGIYVVASGTWWLM